jgi:hypothetical protein
LLAGEDEDNVMRYSFLLIALLVCFTGKTATAASSIWLDADGDGLPESDTLSVVVGQTQTVAIWIDSDAFNWTNFLAYVDYSPDIVVDSVSYTVTGGGAFPIDYTSQPNTIGLGGSGYSEDGVTQLAVMYVHATSSYGVIRVTPITDENEEVFSQLGVDTDYELFSEASSAYLQVFRASDFLFEWADSSSAAVGYPSSLALDGSTPHIAYHDGTNFDLKYATKSGGIWTREIVDATGDTGHYPSVAIDGSDRIQIAYTPSANGTGSEPLRYAIKASGSWTRESVNGTASNYACCAALALSGNDPCISFLDFNNIVLRYARKSSGSWSAETVVNQFTAHSLAVDGSGVPHIAYKDGTSNDLRHAYKSGATWTHETIDGSANDVGSNPSIVADASGNIYIAYIDETLSALKYAVKTASSLTIVTVDPFAGTFGPVNLRLDAQLNPHIIHSEGRYARRIGGEWVIELINDADEPFGTTIFDLDLDAEGLPHITGHNILGSKDLRYAIVPSVTSVGDPVFANASRLVVHPNPATQGSLQIAYAASRPEVAPLVMIYDVTGRLIRELRLSASGGDMWRGSWDQTDDQGRTLSAGIYFLKLNDSDRNEARRLVLLR